MNGNETIALQEPHASLKLLTLLVFIAGKLVMPVHPYQVSTNEVAELVSINGNEVRLVQLYQSL